MMKIDLTNVSRHAKALALFLFAPLMSQAQTASSFYQPGVTTEGAVYFLPKTAVRVTIQVEKTTYTPGDFCKYAERYLRVKGVSPTPSVSYRITTIRQEAVAVADTSKRYAVEFNAKTSASNVNLSSDGILLSINTDPVRRPGAKPFTPAPRPAAVNPRQWLLAARQRWPSSPHRTSTRSVRAATYWYADRPTTCRRTVNSCD